jgi:hypothetical protein
MDINFVAFGAAIGAGIARSVFGWLGGAIADGKIDGFEWKQLAQTVVRVGFLTVGSFFVIDWLNPENAEIAAAGFGILLDMILQRMKAASVASAVTGVAKPVKKK